VTRVEEDFCEAAHLLAHKKGDEVRYSCQVAFNLSLLTAYGITFTTTLSTKVETPLEMMS
jgi:hypothetical protein